MNFENNLEQNENIFYNSNYYERQANTPPFQYSINSSMYSTSPEMSNSSTDSSYCFYTPSQTSYTNYRYPIYSDTLYPHQYYSKDYNFQYNFDNVDNYAPTCSYGSYSYQQYESRDYKIDTNLMSSNADSEKNNLELKNNDNQKSKKRRIRTQFSIEQKKYLLTIFRDTIYPSKEQLELTAQKLSVSMATVQTWFKNTRSKQKKLCNTKYL